MLRKSFLIRITCIATLGLSLLFSISCNPDELKKGTAIVDVVRYGDKSIVIAKWYGGIVISDDDGKIWKNANTMVVVEKLIVDSNNRIWGFHGWHGIHEQSQASLSYSDDGGHNWKLIELDPEVIIPEDMFLSVDSIPFIVGHNGQLWSLSDNNNNERSDWQKLGVPNPERIGLKGAYLKDNMFVVGKEYIWRSGDSGNNWLEFPIENVYGLFTDYENCWAVTKKGELYKNMELSNWGKIIDIAEIQYPVSIEALNQYLLVSARSIDYKDIGVLIDDDRQIVFFDSNLEMHSNTFNNIDSTLFFSDEGLFRFEQSEWNKIWPGN